MQIRFSRVHRDKRQGRKTEKGLFRGIILRLRVQQVAVVDSNETFILHADALRKLTIS